MFPLPLRCLTNVCLRETICGTARSEKEGSSRSLGVDLSTHRTHSCLSCPDRLHSPTFGRFAATLCRPVPLSGKLSFPTLPVSGLENPQENLFTLGVSAQPRTRAQGRAEADAAFPPPPPGALGCVAACLAGWVQGPPGAQMWSLGPLRETWCSDAEFAQKALCRLGKKSSRSLAQRLFSRVAYGLARGTSRLPQLRKGPPGITSSAECHPPLPAPPKASSEGA